MRTTSTASPLPARVAGLHQLALALAFLMAAAPSARGQQEQQPASQPGWVLSPSIGFGQSYEGNVVLAGRLAPTVNDYLSVLDPAIDIRFRGRKTVFDAAYSGSFMLYRSLGELNGFDQHANAFLSRRLSPRVSILVQNHIARAETTDSIELNDVPFARIGSRFENLSGGVEIALARHWTATGSYRFDWVDFDDDDVLARFLRGGHSHAVGGTIDRQLTAHASAGFEYEVRHAVIAGGEEVFQIHRSMAHGSAQLTRTVSLTGGLGFAALTGTLPSASSRIGPAWQVALSYRRLTTALSLSYAGSIVPSYGIGGTVQNQDLAASVRVPLSGNRVYYSGSVAWRRNDPLTDDPFSLSSWWLNSSVGVAATPWLRIEGYYDGSFQDSQRAGGRVDRHRAGVRVVTGTSIRVH